MTLSNQTPFTLTQVALTDTYPVEVTFSDYQSDELVCDHDDAGWGGQMMCSLINPTLAPGEGLVLTIHGSLTQTFSAPKDVVNKVVVTANQNGEIIKNGNSPPIWVTWCKV